MVQRIPDSTYLVLVRHAQTAWNAERRFQGHADEPLNETGRTTIPPVIEALRLWEPDRIYTSDLARAREMAESAGRALDVEVEARSDLRECSYGAWEGLTLDEVEASYAEELAAWHADEDNQTRGGGESLVQMQQRSWGALEEIAGRHPAGTAVVFTHSGPVRAAVCRLFDLRMADRYRFGVDNASISALRRSRKGRWQLILLNQTDHLHRRPQAGSSVADDPEA